MKDMGDLDGLLKRAKDKGVFGTKMRSVVDAANPKGIAASRPDGERYDEVGTVLRDMVTYGIDIIPDVELIIGPQPPVQPLDRVQTLRGLLPICAWCKKIREDNGYWDAGRGLRCQSHRRRVHSLHLPVVSRQDVVGPRPAPETWTA